MRAVADRYVLLPQHERAGGVAKVVKALDTETDGKPVAVKLLPRADADDLHQVLFRREVMALSRLSHPNIVSLLDYGEDDGQNAFYLVFPWVDRQLRDELPSPDDVDWGWDTFAERWGLPLLDALAYAHERQVVHRDVKPSNILVHDGQPLLADFGISKIRSVIVAEATVADFVSRPYAPPDLVGMSRASRDVWGFAATALRCLTAGPFGDYPDLDNALDDVDTPPAVKEVLRRCVSRDPDSRPRDAIELRGLLREIQQRRSRHWMEVHTAQLIVRSEAARRLAAPPFDRDREAVERALQAEFAQGTHLARMWDPRNGRRSAETLDLIGQRRRLRLAVLREQPEFILTKVHDLDDRELDELRRDAWQVVEEVSWSSNPQPAAAARETWKRVLAALDEHYLRLDEVQQIRDENRPFDKWLDLLNAKEDLEAERSARLRYDTVTVTGKRATFHLTMALDTDVIGEDRVCRIRTPGYGRLEVVGGPGVVVAQDERSVTLSYKRTPNPPPAGELVLDPGPSRAALHRQRDAVVSVRSETAVRPELRRLLLDPSRIAEPVSPATVEWFDDRLDEDKRAAVTGALGSADFFLLEGPPGTGKTSFITELVRQELSRNPDARILLVSQTHVAVDNALVRLVDAGLDNVVRLGRPDDTRIAEQAQPHLLDQRMPRWVRLIRERAEQHLEDRARTAEVDLVEVRGAAALRELIAALDDQQSTRARLGELLDAPGRVTVAAPAVSGRVGDDDADEDDTSVAGRLNDRLQRLAEQVAELRGEAATLLGADTLEELLPSGAEPTLEAARAAFDAVVDRTPGLRTLAGILGLQAEWLQRIESSRDLEAVLLRQSRVVAGTCLGFLSHPAVRDLEFDLCILDEASKATATETLVPLARSRRWVLVGDPHQLPPMQEEVLDHGDIMARHGLEQVDVERSLFRDLLDAAPSSARHRLTHQYRMQPGIGDLISDCFYEGTLRSVARPELAGWDALFHKPVAWLDTTAADRRREQRVGTSTVNHHEVRVVRKAVNRLRNALAEHRVRTDDGGPLRVLVLTAYRKQMEELRRAVAGPVSPLLEIEVNTVDAVQGREADITVYSVTRSNDRHELGFLGPRYWRRVNVALSRSRYGLLVVGDASFCDTNSGPLRDVLAHVRKNPDTCWIGPART